VIISSVERPTDDRMTTTQHLKVAVARATWVIYGREPRLRLLERSDLSPWSDSRASTEAASSGRVGVWESV
jgi:hypothetical protein